jgi:hypothetical protein
MKVLFGDLTIAEEKGGWDELGTLKVIGEKDPQSRGYRLDNFTHQGPNGKPHLSRVGGVEPQCSRRISCPSRLYASAVAQASV